MLLVFREAIFLRKKRWIFRFSSPLKISAKPGPLTAAIQVPPPGATPFPWDLGLWTGLKVVRYLESQTLNMYSETLRRCRVLVVIFVSIQKTIPHAPRLGNIYQAISRNEFGNCSPNVGKYSLQGAHSIHSFMFVAFRNVFSVVSLYTCFSSPFLSTAILFRSHLYYNTMYVHTLCHTYSAHPIFHASWAQQPFLSLKNPPVALRFNNLPCDLSVDLLCRVTVWSSSLPP